MTQISEPIEEPITVTEAEPYPSTVSPEDPNASNDPAASVATINEPGGGGEADDTVPPPDRPDAESVDDGMLPPGNPLPPTGTPTAPVEGASSAKRPRSRAQTKQHYQERLAHFREVHQSGDGAEGDARAHRITLLAGIAELVREPGFNTKHFCEDNFLPFTKATVSNPCLAVIKAVLPNTDKKLASKWGIGLVWAIDQCDRQADLAEYLRANSIEGCVKASRAATRATKPTRPPQVRLKITGVPTELTGRVAMIVEITGTAARYVGPAPTRTVSASPAVSAAPPSGGDGTDRATSSRPGADEVGQSSPCPAAPDARHGGIDAPGGQATEEVPAAA